MASELKMVIISHYTHLSKIYMGRLERNGWNIYHTDNIKDGNKIIVKNRPDVILLDGDLLEDIFTEVKKIKSLPTISGAKIAVIVESLAIKEAEKMYSVGIDLILILNHFTPQNLVNKMKKLVKE